MSLYSTTQLARSGLLNYWRLGDTSGTTATDSKGSNPGAYSGGYTLNSSGLLLPQFDASPSVRFATNGVVAVPDAGSLRPAAFSVEAIILPTSPAPAFGYAAIAAKDDLANGWALTLYNGNELVMTTNAAAVGDPVLGAVPIGLVSHVAMTYDGTTARLYLNGALVYTYVHSFTAATSALGIAGWAGTYFNGSIQEVSFYNRALTQTELTLDAQITAMAFANWSVYRTLQLASGFVDHGRAGTDAAFPIVTTDHVVRVPVLTAARTYTLPDPATLAVMQEFEVVDEGGTAATFNVTIADVTGVTVSVIATRGGSWRGYWNGTKWISRSLLASVNASQSPYTALQAFGNAYALGSGATGSHGYVAKLAAMLGITGGNLVNSAVSGAYSDGDNGAPSANGWVTVLQDVPDTSGVGPYLPSVANQLYTVQFGMTELAMFGAGPTAMAQYKSALRTIISRLRAGHTGVFEESHASVTKTGWTVLTYTGSNSGSGLAYNATNGQPITIAVPADFPGGTIALGTIAQGATAGVHTYTVDSIVAGSLDTRTLAGTVAGKASPNVNGCVQRLTNLAPGAHTIVDTPSLIGVGNYAWFDYWQIEAPEPPTILLVTHPRLTSAGYATYSTFPVTPTDAMAQAGNVALRQVAAEFDSKVLVVETDPLIGANAAYYNAGALPNLNDAGHSLVAAACMRALTSQGAWLPAFATAS